MLPIGIPQDEKTLEQRLAEVTILVVEMEGVLTDGRGAMDAQGRESLVFSRRDALGLKMWRKDGYKVVVLLRQGLTAGQQWCQAHGLPFLTHDGVKNTLMQAIIFDHAAHPKDVCYLAADLEDLQAMMIAGVAVCPADADQWVRESCHLVLERGGGQGVAREIIDRLLASRVPPSE